MEIYNRLHLEKYNDLGSQISKLATISDGVNFQPPINICARTEIQAKVTLGQFVFINSDTVLFPNVDIGKFCSIARGVQLGVNNHPLHMLSTHPFQYSSLHFRNHLEYKNIKKTKFQSQPKTIVGNDVWIGANAIIRAGVTIGDGAVIASGAVINKDIPPYAIAGGVPAHIIRYRFRDDEINDLIKIKWWHMENEIIFNAPFEDIKAAIAYFKSNM